MRYVMNKMTVVIIVFVVTAILCTVLSKVLKNNIFKKLLKELKDANFDEYFKTIDSMLCKLYFPAFNREYMRLNGYVIKGNKKEVDGQFEVLLSMRVNKKQEIDIVMKAFYYFLEDENKKKAKQMLERIRKFGDDYYNESEVMYNVCIEKSIQYIDEMEEALKDPECKDINRGMFLYLLGLQYGNDNQKKKMKEYLKEAQGPLKGTPYELKIRALLK